MGEKRLQIKLVRSSIRCPWRQKRTVKALGLRKMNQIVIRPDNPAMRGMVAKIAHLVEVTEIEV